MSGKLTASCMCLRMDTVVTDSTDSYEPDWEDLTYQLYKEREFEQWVSWIRESEDQCRASTKPDSQLRSISREGKALSRELWQDYHFDIATDSFELSEDSEHYVTVPRSGLPRTLTRKEKRRIRGNLRKRLRKQFGILTKRGCSPRQVGGYEDMSSTTVVAAV